MSDDAPTSGPPPAPAGSRLALPAGFMLDGYRLDRVASESTAAIVYAGTDVLLGVPVAVKEYLPGRLARRDATGKVIPFEEAVFERGLQAFFGEARALARCSHPALLRVVRFMQTNGTAYRVMPWVDGTPLTEVRRDMFVAPDEAALRALLHDLLGALEAFHATGQVHGAVTPANILLLGNDRPLLLGPEWSSRKSASELIESLMIGIAAGFAPREQMAGSAAEPQGPWTDLYSLGAVLRFCITGQLPAPDAAVQAPPHWSHEQRSAYSAALLAVIDAALSPAPQERPQNVAQFREWLEHMPARAGEGAAEPDFNSLIERMLQGVPGREEPVMAAAPEPPPASAPAAANDDVAIQRVLEEIALTAAAPVDDEPSKPAPAPPRKTHRAVLWGGAALVALMLMLFVGTVMRDEQRTLHVQWPAAGSAAVDPIATGRAPSALPELPSAPTGAGVEGAPGPAADPAPPRGAPAVPSEAAPIHPAPAVDAPPATVPPAAARSAAPTAPANDPTAASTQPAPALPSEGVAAPTHLAAAPAEATPAGTRPPAARAAEAARKAGSPRDQCGGRTPFATYRCMQTQCAKAQWTEHPQCKRLRETDSVEE
jgi:serine/threonine protein kinase